MFRSRMTTRATRPSPPTSATYYRVGQRRKGNDGQMYVVMATRAGVKRWVKSKKLPRRHTPGDVVRQRRDEGRYVSLS